MYKGKETILALMMFGCIALLSLPAQADLILSDTDLPDPVTVIDFSAFSGPFQFTAGPIVIGTYNGNNILWSTTYSRSVIGNGVYGLATNGSWDSGRIGYTGLNTTGGTMYFNFNGSTVSGVGGFVNYAPPSQSYGDAIITAYASDMTVLEQYNISSTAPISTPSGTNEGAFRGILRPSADIAVFGVSNAYVVLDDLNFTPTPIPAPGAIILGGIGLSFAGGLLKRRKEL